MTKAAGNAIIMPSSTKARKAVQFICRIDRAIYACVSKDITTDEVVITQERAEHIRRASSQ